MASNLEEIEQIKQLKARYFRHMDTRVWEEWRKCFTADVVATYDGPPRLDPTAPLDPRHLRERVGPCRVACE